MLNKNNKYKIYYNLSPVNSFKWRIAVKKLNLILAYKNINSYGNHFYNNNYFSVTKLHISL